MRNPRIRLGELFEGARLKDLLAVMDWVVSELKNGHVADWSVEEVRAVVSAYMEMLTEEIAGRPYVKARYNVQVQNETGRSKGSVEYKLQNVSAMLDVRGLRWIEGYKPARNAQATIGQILDELLATNEGLAAKLELPVPTVTPALPSSLDEVFVSPPPRGAAKTSEQSGTGQKNRKWDRADADARNHELGEKGEEFVVSFEATAQSRRAL